MNGCWCCPHSKSCSPTRGDYGAPPHFDSPFRNSLSIPLCPPRSCPSTIASRHMLMTLVSCLPSLKAGLKVSPAFFEQSKKLERARMGDFLKHKIQTRPDRQFLIEQHILEDTTVSPALQDKQRQLKKARLADDLNDRLSHRPGPLELIKGNILVADERLAQAIREGSIHFKATSEGEAVKHPPPLFHLEDPDTSSDGTRSPQDQPPSCELPFVPSAALPEATFVPTIVFTSAPTAAFTQTAPMCVGNSVCIAPAPNTSLVSTDQSTTTIPHVSTCTPQTRLVSGTQNNQIKSITFTPGTTAGTIRTDSSHKNRKKSKSKVQPKTRTIKFHEYKVSIDNPRS